VKGKGEVAVNAVLVVWLHTCLGRVRKIAKSDF